MKFVFNARVHTRVADTDTPVSLYLKIREHFAECILMERNGTGDPEHQYSYICCLPVATISVKNNQLYKKYPDETSEILVITDETNVVSALEDFNTRFEINGSENHYETKGLYGYISYDALSYFETIKLSNKGTEDRNIDTLHFSFYSVVLVFDHFKQQCHIIEFENENTVGENVSYLKSLLLKPVETSYPFKASQKEVADCTDAEFLQRVEYGRQHCFMGDVFQVVLSRGFHTHFTGDDFTVYRALRSLNQTPYLFYFDYGDYRLMGASPEAQLKVKENKATIHPIAGTYKRGANAAEDSIQIENLRHDAKENAEHVMLVDLARNDLSKNYQDVQVEIYKEIHPYAYVIHMVSEVSGQRPIGSHGSLQVMADTFPAGTLSGAPKFKAMQLIDRYETEARGFYGGSIGFIGFNGDINQAIMIRTVLSKNQKLYYQAGAGIVSCSVAKQELQEVDNKLRAIRTSIQQANTFSNEDFNY
jgi:anthranilate synthase component 1